MTVMVTLLVRPDIEGIGLLLEQGGYRPLQDPSHHADFKPCLHLEQVLIEDQAGVHEKGYVKKPANIRMWRFALFFPAQPTQLRPGRSVSALAFFFL